MLTSHSFQAACQPYVLPTQAHHSECVALPHSSRSTYRSRADLVRELLILRDVARGTDALNASGHALDEGGLVAKAVSVRVGVAAAVVGGIPARLRTG